VREKEVFLNYWFVLSFVRVLFVSFDLSNAANNAIVLSRSINDIKL
jgi:hypothetical protein